MEGQKMAMINREIVLEHHESLVCRDASSFALLAVQPGETSKTLPKSTHKKWRFDWKIICKYGDFPLPPSTAGVYMSYIQEGICHI